MKKVPTLLDALNLKLLALYDIEKHILKSLPKMVKLASDNHLKESLSAHLEETRNHILRLEQCMKLSQIKPKRIKVEGIRGIAEDAEWTLNQEMPQDLRDALIIASAQYVEHYEMAGYSSAKTWATMLGFTDMALLLSQTLEEEKAADEKLTMIADASINRRAVRV
jgi:ferritin-like metal-binding protein YciE